MAFHEFNDRARRARQGRVDGTRAPQDEAPEVHRVQTVRVLRGVDTLQNGVRVDPARQRQLHDVARAGRVRVELINRSLHLFLRGVGRQVHTDRLSADFRTVTVLTGDVGDGPGVLAHEDRAETRDDPGLAQTINAFLQLRLDRGSCRLSIQDPGGALPGSPHDQSPA